MCGQAQDLVGEQARELRGGGLAPLGRDVRARELRGEGPAPAIRFGTFQVYCRVFWHIFSVITYYNV